MTPIDLNEGRERRLQKDRERERDEQYATEYKEARVALATELNKAWDFFAGKNGGEDPSVDAGFVFYDFISIMIEVAQRRGVWRVLAAAQIGQALFDVGRQDGYDEAYEEIEDPTNSRGSLEREYRNLTPEELKLANLAVDASKNGRLADEMQRNPALTQVVFKLAKAQFPN